MMSPGTYTNAAAVTPSDATILRGTVGLFIGGAGNLTVVMAEDGATVAFNGLTAGTLLPIRVKQVKSTGTTATAIVALR